MIEIEYRGKKYQADDDHDMIRQLRKGRLTQQEIGSLFGLTRQRIAQILGPTGRLDFPELNDVRTFNQPDEIIAFKLGVPVSRVSVARRRLGLRQHNKIDIVQRRKEFSQFLFGKDPGPEFVDFIKKEIESLADGKKNVIEEFYISGTSQSLADNLNTDSDRVYRHHARVELKNMILAKYTLEQLIEKGVICE